MEKDIALGPEGGMKLKVEGGMLIVEISHVHASGEVTLVAKEDSSYFLDKLDASIKNPIVSAAIAIVKSALKAA